MNLLPSTTKVLKMLVHTHGKKMSFANMPNFTGQSNLLFRTEPKTDDFFNINICCVLLVDYEQSFLQYNRAYVV